MEIYFEKENIWTRDAKGELLITIMSSLAQEESRSISENTTWGKRKMFADGRARIGFKHFLGYDRGPDGEFIINEEQAVMDISRTTVTEIYERARYKISDCIVNGKQLVISGGNYRICSGKHKVCCERPCRRYVEDLEKNIIAKGRKDMKIAVTYENGEGGHTCGSHGCGNNCH